MVVGKHYGQLVTYGITDILKNFIAIKKKDK